MSDYNGWTNYETWCINLWLSNEEGLYHQALELAQEVIEDQGTDSEALELAETFRNWVDDLCEDICPGSRSGASFVTDLLGAALSEVDWREIAGAWLEDAREGVDA